MGPKMRHRTTVVIIVLNISADLYHQNGAQISSDFVAENNSDTHRKSIQVAKASNFDTHEFLGLVTSPLAFARESSAKNEGPDKC